MSISYQPKDAAVQSVQLKRQTLVLKEKDAAVVSAFETIHPIVEIKEALSVDAGNEPCAYLIPAAGGNMVAASAAVIQDGVSTNSAIKLTFGSAPAAGDVLVVHFVTNK